MGWIGRVPAIDLALIVSLTIAGLTAVATRRRGGRFRGLPGWTVFWLVLGGILICLSRASAYISLPLLAALMFVALRNYFFVAPVRPKDRYAVLAAYAAVPFALYPGLTGSDETFLATVPIVLFLAFPVLLSLGEAQQGWLDSIGRVFLGVALFVFCAAHLGLLAREHHRGLAELFGTLVIAAELVQRLAGRYRGGSGWIKPSAGIAASGLLAAALGFWLGPACGLVEEDAARAGFLVAIAVAMGAAVADALIRDLSLGPSSAGRGAILDRSIPAVYAAPVFFHYLNHFA